MKKVLDRQHPSKMNMVIVNLMVNRMEFRKCILYLCWAPNNSFINPYDHEDEGRVRELRVEVGDPAGKK